MLLAGFSAILNLPAILIIIAGVAVGIIFGAIPGLSATMAVALCLPISFGMEPIKGMALLVALYIGGISGGLISAILLKIPGTPSSVATTFDGAPLAEKGEAGKALGVGIVFSFLGTLISIVALLFISPYLAKLALRFGPFEYFAVGVFSLTLISSLVGGSVYKGLVSAVLGLCFTMVGSAPIDAFPRFTFGFRQLNAGFDILPVLVGLFAIAEIIHAAEEGFSSKKESILSYKMEGIFGFSWAEFKSQIWNFFRSALIGIGIGILPGIGGGTSNVIAYIVAKNQSKYPEKFGTGVIDGIVAPETANNATIGGAMIPLLSLGIPGDSTTAMLLGGLLLHGFSPGPLMFQKNGDIVYAIFAAMIVANIAMIVLEFVGLRFFVRLLSIPRYILLPVVMALCFVGAFGLNNRIFDIAAVLIFGVVGYLMSKAKIPTTPFILGFILGGMVETNLRRGLMNSRGSFAPFFTRPISCVFLVLAFLSIIGAVVNQVRLSKKAETD